MAEVVLEIVLKKLADVIHKEAQSLGGVGAKVKRVQLELIRIKCCLKDVDSKRKEDGRVQIWLNELCDAAYRIEDAIDTFFLQVEDLRQKYPRFLQKLGKLFNKPLEVRILHKLGNELDDIQNLLEEIYESRVTYGISLEDETEVVGMQADKNNILEIVLKKLADVIDKEAQSLGGGGTKVERVQRELTRNKCCLKDADSKREGDERVQNWLNKVRDVAHRIEDAIDTFFLEVEDLHQKYLRFLQKLWKLFNKPLEVRILHKLGNELDNILNLLKEISERWDYYELGGLPLEDKSKGEAVKMSHRRAINEEIDETQVVGMQADKNNILELLRPQKTSRRAVITIVGPGGLGKTTLACMVYRSAKEDFDYHIMLSISQQYSLTDLLGKMISKYNKDFVRENQDVGDLVNELRSFLSSRRYLIILDDVWTSDMWNELKDVLPDVKNGSQVLITSRIIEIVRFANPQIPPYELNFLDDRESLELLLKKALPNQEPNEKCPDYLLDLARELSEKCEGLPLALVVLGGILATKELYYPAWKMVLQTMNWYADGKDCMQILEMSYEKMPYYLKACFQYLASFPENYKISAKSLIRMWVAEGFIPLKGGPTIEITAVDCLEELAKRSMVQVLSRSTNGLIKYFKVHAILRHLAMDKAGHEKIVTVFSHASDDTKPNIIIRRASLQAKEKNSQFMKYVGPNTRSLLFFGSEYCGASLHCSNFRLLKVLEIVGILDGYELKSLDELIHLKYLRLTKCDIDLSSCSFNRLKRLETLDVRGTMGRPPCDDFWTIGTLKHVLDDEYKPFFDRPISIATRSNLQTLKWVTLQRACDAKLPNLRRLCIKCESDNWVSITNLLQTLPSLVSLGICRFSLPLEIVYPKALPNYQNLQSLYLHGIWPDNVNVEASLLPSHLLKLSLEDSNLNHNPMPELGKLKSLKKLCFQGFVFTGIADGLIICPEGFPFLQYLKVNDEEEITDLRVAEGVMPKLTYLKVRSNLKVHLPPELQHVTVERL